MSRSSPDIAADTDPAPPDARPAESVPPWWVFLLVGLGGFSVSAYYIRRVFLFSDDYLFLGQAKEQGTLTVDYLGAGLFNHFSPFSRLFNYLMVNQLPGQPLLVLAVMLALVGTVIFACIVLVLALFGRTWLAAVGALVLSFSLCLLPLGNWWTAGVNILPAIAGSAFSLAGMAMLVRGRSRWWGVLSIAGYLVAVLDYESAMLTAGYVAMWVLLFRRRVTADSFHTVMRRTWWVWAALVAIGALSLVNYRWNYYLPAPTAPLTDVAKGLGVSLFNTVIPTVIGWYEGPVNRTWFSTVGTALGILALLTAVVWTVRRAPSSWRGWAFATVGWLLPSLALVLNRPWDFAYNAIYVPLPMTMVVVGVLESFAAALDPGGPGSPAGRDVGRRGRRWPAVVACLVAGFLIGHSLSAPTAATGQLNFATDPRMRDFIANAQDSAAAIAEANPGFSVIDSRVNDGKVAAGFFPYNTVSRIFTVSGPTVPFDRWGGPHYQVDEDGALVPVSMDWTTGVSVPSAPGAGAVTVTGAATDPVAGGDSGCFTSMTGTTVSVTLPTPVTGSALVVGVTGTVDAETHFGWSTQGAVGAAAVPSDLGTFWAPGEPGMLRPIWEPSVQVVNLFPLTAGSRICLAEISVGQVTADTGDG